MLYQLHLSDQRSKLSTIIIAHIAYVLYYIYIGHNKPIYKKMNSYCDPTIEDFPLNLYESEIRFQLSSDCCGTGIYHGSEAITCLNCTEPCKVIEDIVIE